jgi:hypothetical protein
MGAPFLVGHTEPWLTEHSYCGSSSNGDPSDMSDLIHPRVHVQGGLSVRVCCCSTRYIIGTRRHTHDSFADRRGGDRHADRKRRWRAK